MTEGDGQRASVLVTFAVPRSFAARPGAGAYVLALAAAGGRPRRWYQLEVDPAVPGGVPARASCVEFSLDYKEGAGVNEPKLRTFARWFAGTVHVRQTG